jgi:DnaA family protein
VNRNADSLLPSAQLPLSVGLDDGATLDNFLAWSGVAAPFAGARGALDGDAPTLLHGEAQGGKSHLLQALCHRAAGSVYLPLGAMIEYAPAAVFEGLEVSALIAIDDLHRVTGNSAWEEGLFHLINRARSAGTPLWLASRFPPAESAELPDLASRLAAGLVWSMPAPGDEEKLAILRFRAERRGLSLPETVARYLLTRERRTLQALLATLDRLDTASLSLQRPLTIPFVREVMGW